MHQEHWTVGKTQRTCWMFKAPCLIAGKTYLTLIKLQGANLEYMSKAMICIMYADGFIYIYIGKP